MALEWVSMHNSHDNNEVATRWSGPVSCTCMSMQVSQVCIDIGKMLNM